ncbi:hypothetical protein ACHAXA_008269 [Cyclostephanos tholiformis]|uniref:Uncharacterized protein n=1 Tax=Cyclostephanos tholiformis TaxID=382380 RepID=A0ABD3R729_9STRA
MVQSGDLHSSLVAESSAQSLNQMIRWVMTKEEHCSKIITLISEYCLCQRVKKEVFANDKDYVEALKAHHAVMQAAMKCGNLWIRQRRMHLITLLKISGRCTSPNDYVRARL